MKVFYWIPLQQWLKREEERGTTTTDSTTLDERCSGVKTFKEGLASQDRLQEEAEKMEAIRQNLMQETGKKPAELQQTRTTATTKQQNYKTNRKKIKE